MRSGNSLKYSLSLHILVLVDISCSIANYFSGNNLKITYKSFNFNLTGLSEDEINSL